MRSHFRQDIDRGRRPYMARRGVGVAALETVAKEELRSSARGWDQATPPFVAQSRRSGLMVSVGSRSSHYGCLAHRVSLMKWRKGFFQLWMVASSLWVSLIGWPVYADYTDPIWGMQEAWTRYNSEHGGSETVCFELLVDIVPFGRVAHWYIAIAVVPPVLLMLVGLLFLRLRDFTHSRSQ